MSAGFQSQLSVKGHWHLSAWKAPPQLPVAVCPHLTRMEQWFENVPLLHVLGMTGGQGLLERFQRISPHWCSPGEENKIDRYFIHYLILSYRSHHLFLRVQDSSNSMQVAELWFIIIIIFFVIICHQIIYACNSYTRTSIASAAWLFMLATDYRLRSVLHAELTNTVLRCRPKNLNGTSSSMAGEEPSSDLGKAWSPTLTP